MPTNLRAIRYTILGFLVAASFTLVTVYYREGSEGPLHRTQLWLGQTFAPAEGVVQRVAQPFRDASNWYRDVSNARAQRDRLARENARLRQELARRAQNDQLLAELQAELGYARSLAFPHLGDYVGHVAMVLDRAPQLYAQKALLDQGSRAGIGVNDPVVSGVAAAGTFTGVSLIGRVTAVTPDTCWVTLISDPSMAVAATVAGRTGADGILYPNASDASTQVLDFVRKTYTVQNGDQVVTSGYLDPTGLLRSYYPSGIPIGLVSYVTQSDTQDYKSIQVTPWVDLQAFRTAMILIPRRHA